MRVYVLVSTLLLLAIFSTNGNAISLKEILSHKALRHVNRDYHAAHQQRSPTDKHGVGKLTDKRRGDKLTDTREKDKLTLILREYAEVCKLSGRHYDERSGQCLKLIDNPNKAVDNQAKMNKRVWGNPGNWVVDNQDKMNKRAWGNHGNWG